MDTPIVNLSVSKDLAKVFNMAAVNRTPPVLLVCELLNATVITYMHMYPVIEITRVDARIIIFHTDYTYAICIISLPEIVTKIQIKEKETWAYSFSIK